MLVITWNFRNKVQKSGFMWPLLPGSVRGQLRASFNVSEQKFVFLLLEVGAAAVRNILARDSNSVRSAKQATRGNKTSKNVVGFFTFFAQARQKF